MRRILIMGAKILGPMLLTRLMRRRKKARPVPNNPPNNQPNNPHADDYDGETIDQ